MQKSNVIDLQTPPRGLSSEAGGLWRSILSDYAIDDSAGLAILLQLCETLDRVRQCQQQIERDGLTVPGYNDQTRPHPLLKTETEYRRQLLSCYRALKLEPEAS